MNPSVKTKGKCNESVNNEFKIIRKSIVKCLPDIILCRYVCVCFQSVFSILLIAFITR